MSKEKMPNWDLSDYYPSPDSKEFKTDLAKFGAESQRFEKKYKGKLAELDGETFGKALKEFEDINEIGAKLGTYSYLLRSTNLDNSEVMKFYSSTEEKLSDVSLKTVFLGLEINSLSDENIADKMKSPATQKYAPFLEQTRAFKPHTLNEDLEKILIEKDIVGRSAWVKEYDEKQASLIYTVNGKEYNDAEIGSLMCDPDEKIREAAGKEFGRVSTENRDFFAKITNNIAKDKEINDRWRGFKTPVASQNLSNQVKDEVVDALSDTVKDNYANISHRYYKMKAKWLGKEKLGYWDRNAPVPGMEEPKYTWEEAKQTVLDAYAEFSPEMAKIGKKFFENNWIDVAPKKGKEGGAYAMPGTTSTHSYLMLNFQGKAGDVMTLAHELGHGVHQELAKSQGQLQADTPLTLAETASVFGEMITFKSLLKKETDPKKKLALIADKAGSMINTAVRQIAFHEYEKDIHNERKNGELSADRISELWNEKMKDSLGPSVDIGKDTKDMGGQIPHLIHTPFYVYAYSYADCMVNSLYKVHEEGKVEDFPKKFMNLLSKGGTQKDVDLLKPFNLDPSKKDFWQKGLNVITELVDEAEKLSKQLGMDKTKGKTTAKKSPAVIKKAIANAKQR
jgi:oligoendopeptidase F